MNTLEHIRQTTKEKGLKIGLLSATPDLFQLGRIIPNESIKRFCKNMHNTEWAVGKMEKASSTLGEAWKSHREQDLATHPFDYEKIPEIPKNSVVTLSGGLDSFITWKLLGMPKAVYFAIGHKAQEQELAKIEAIKQKYPEANITIDKRLNLSDIEMDNGYIPYRNLFFLLQASYISPNIVFSQILEWAPDKNKRFYRKVENLIGDITDGAFQELEEKKVRVYTPFSNYTKTGLIKRYLEEGNDPQELTDLTVSCYSKDSNCGKCNACFSRYVAMENNGIHEQYRETPDASKFKKRISFKDFKIDQTAMYIRRYLEMKKYL